MTDTKQQLDRKARRKLKRKLYGKYEEVASRYKELKNKAIAKSSITRDDRPLTLKSIEKITKAFPNINEAYLRGKESNMFLKQKPGYSIANEPQSEYSKDVVKELIDAKNEIIELLKENSRLNAELQDCWLQLGAKKEGKQPNFS